MNAKDHSSSQKILNTRTYTHTLCSSAQMSDHTHEHNRMLIYKPAHMHAYESEQIMDTSCLFANVPYGLASFKLCPYIPFSESKSMTACV